MAEKKGSSLAGQPAGGRSGHHKTLQRVTPVHREVRTSATERMYGKPSLCVVKSGKLCRVQVQIG